LLVVPCSFALVLDQLLRKATHSFGENMKKSPDLMVVLLIVFSAGILISSVAQSSLLF